MAQRIQNDFLGGVRSGVIGQGMSHVSHGLGAQMVH